MAHKINAAIYHKHSKLLYMLDWNDDESNDVGTIDMVEEVDDDILL